MPEKKSDSKSSVSVLRDHEKAIEMLERDVLKRGEEIIDFKNDLDLLRTQYTTLQFSYEDIEAARKNAVTKISELEMYLRLAKTDATVQGQIAKKLAYIIETALIG